MRIGIDGRFLLEKNLTGVGEYAVKMVEYWADFFSDQSVVIFLNSYRPIDSAKLEFLKKFPNITVKYFRFPNKILNLFFYFLAWPKIDHLLGKIDIFFSPNINFIPLSKNCRLILSIHDLSFERHPETFSFKRRLWHFLVNPRQLSQRAEKIWAVSQSTAADLKALYAIPEEKIKIIYSPLEFSFFANRVFSLNEKKELQKKYALPERFIFSLSTLEPRKNLVSLIRAFELFMDKANNEKDKELCLVIAGGRGWLWEEIEQFARESRWKKKIYLIGFIDKKDKPLLYQLAEVFVYPSLFEGFGYPPLEAMVSGTPVIVSNNSSLSEVVAEGGILVDPFRPFEIYLALKEFFGQPELKKIYAQKGFLQAKKIFELGKKQIQDELKSIKKAKIKAKNWSFFSPVNNLIV